MPTTIDDRVVRMSFDNKDFESGVSTTMSSLQKLKEALNFGKSSSGDLNLSGIASGLGQLNKRFSTLGIVGMRTLENLTDSAMHFGKTMVNALTTDAIKDGFHEYELQMDSVKTIMASTGADIGTVNKYLDELNTYADKTIYSFSDMTNNIGKFTNAGIKLEDAVMAIKGISNEAAVSGANAAEASRAMYNFSQALSGGSVKLRDWMSIENANMATAEFKQQLIDAGVELGTLSKEADGTYKVLTTNGNGAAMKETITNTKNFRDSLQYSWMTTEVLTKTLKEYADETTEIGKKAYEAAQDVTTFSKLIDTLKEALGSGWNKTFQLIFGDFEEAKKFWTDVSKAIGSVIDSFGDARNAMLQIWHDNGGRDAAIESLKNTWNGLKQVVGTVGEAFRNVFPPMTGEKLIELTKNIRDLTANFKLSKDQADYLRTVFTGLFNIIKIGQRIIVSLYASVKPLIASLEPVRKKILDIMLTMSKFITKIANSDDMYKTFKETLPNGLKQFVEGLENVIQKIKSVSGASDSFKKNFEKLNKTIDAGKQKLSSFFPIFDKKDKVEKATKSVKKLNDTIKETTKTAKDNEKTVERLTKKESLISTITSILKSDESIPRKFEKIKKAIKKSIDEFKQIGILSVADSVLSLGKSFDKATASIGKFFNKIKSGIPFLNKATKDSGSGGSFFESIKKKFSFIFDLVDKIIPKLKEGFSYIQSNFPKIVKYFAGDNFGDLLDNVTKIFTIGWYHNINNLIKTQTKGFESIIGAISNVSKLMDTLKGGADKLSKSVTSVFDSISDKIATNTKTLGDNNISTNLIKIAGAIAIFTFSLIQLSKIKPEKLAVGIGAIVASLTVMYKTISVIQNMSKNFSNVGEMFQFNNLATQFIKLGIVIAIITSSVKNLGELKRKDLIEGVLGLAAIVAILIVTFKQMASLNSMSVDIGSISTSLIAFSIGIRLLVMSVKALGKMDLTDMMQGLVGVLVLLEAINLFTREAKSYQIDVKSALALILTIETIKIMANAALKLGGLDIPSFVKGLGGVLTLLSAVYLFIKKTKTYSIDVSSAIALVLTIETIKMMTNAALSLGGLDFNSFAQGLVGVLVLLEAINLFTREIISTNINAKTIVILLTVTAVISSLTKQILNLASLDFTQVLQGVGSIIAFFEGIALFLSQLESMSVSTKDLMFLVSIAGAINNVGKSIALLGAMDPDRLMQGAIGLGAILVALSGTLIVLTHVKGSIKEGAAGLVIIALAIMVLVPSLEKLGSLDMDSIVSMIVSLGASLLMLFTAGYAMGENSEAMIKGAASMVILSAAILILAPALKLLSTIDLESLVPMLIGLAGSLVVLFAAGYIMGQNALLLSTGALAMILLSSAILVLSPALRLLGSMDIGQIIGMIVSLASALTVLYIAGVAFGGAAPLIAEGAGALLIFGGAIALLGAGLLAIAYAMPMLGVGIKQFSDNISEANANLAESLGKQLGELAKAAADFIVGVLTNIAKSIADGLPKIGKFLIDSFVSIINLLADAIRTEGPRIISAFANLFSSILELGVTCVQYLLKLIPGIGDFLSEQLEGTKTIIREKLAPESMKQIGSDAIGQNGLAGGIESQQSAVNDSSSSISDNILGTLSNALTGGKGFDIASIFGSDLSNGMMSANGLIGDSANSLGDTITGNLESIDTSPYGFAVGSNYADGVDSSQFDVNKSINELTGNVTGSLENNNMDFEKLATQNISSYTNQFQNRSTQNDAKQAAANLANEGIAGAASKKKDFIATGKDSGRGYGDGLDAEDIKSYVEKKAGNLGTIALRGLKKRLDSNSPSKETMKIGVFSGEGFALGLIKMAKAVKKNGANLGSSALDGMRDTLTNLSDLASADMVTDPMIRPVLDLSDIQNGVGTMNSMFGSPIVGLKASLGVSGNTVKDLHNAASTLKLTGSGNNDVVGEMIALRKDVKNLGQSMSQMKMYMDGREVGGIVSNEVDRRLGIRYLRNRREGRA